jgi:hypothetical protein
VREPWLLIPCTVPSPPSIASSLHPPAPLLAAVGRLFERMVAAELAPPWVMDNILLTGDATRLTPFYKRVLGLG